MRVLEGKVAVIAGCSAARGSGWAIAERLADAGANIIVAARRLEKLLPLAARTGGTAMACDIADENQVKGLAQRALDLHGKLDIAVNAAGYASGELLANAEAVDLERNMAVNYYGNFYFIKYMAQAIGSNGSITIMSSLAVTNPMQPLAAYACSKAAADCLVRYAAIEYGPHNIRVNSIRPGPIRSEMTQGMFEMPGYIDALNREVPLGRVGEPADFADAVLWLAGGAYVTGLNLPVCGGLQLHRFPFPDEVPDAFGDVHGRR